MWNYRIVRWADGDLSLHEVYYDQAGQVTMIVPEPHEFAFDASEGVEALLQDLRAALEDAESLPVLDCADIPDMAGMVLVKGGGGWEVVPA